MTEELIKLMLSVTGGDAIEDLRDQLGYTNVAVEQLKEAFQRGDVTTDEFLRTAKKLTDQQKMLAEAVAEADAVMARQEAAAKAEADAIAELAAEQQRLADMQEDAARAAIDLADAQDLLGTATYDVVEAQTAMGGSTVYVVGTADDAEQAFRNELTALDDLKDGASLSAAEMARLGATKTGVSNVASTLKASIKALEAELVQLRKDVQSGTISLDEFRAKSAMAEQALAIQRATLGAVGDQFALSGQKLLQFGQTLDDLQYVGEMGLRPILNNIMQFAPSIGIAMIAVDQFYRHWDEIRDLFDKGIPRPVLDQTEELKRKLDEAQKVTEELGKKTRLDLDELTRYKQATEDVKKFNDELKKRDELERILSQKTEDQQQYGGAFQKAISASGGQAALDELISAVKGEADGKGNIYNILSGKVTSAEEYAKDIFREGTSGSKLARDEAATFLSKAYGEQSTFGKNITKYSPEQAERNRAMEDEARHAAEESQMAERRRQEIAAKEAIGIKEAEDLARRTKEKKDAEAKRSLEQSRAEIRRNEAERQAEAVRKAAETDRDRMDPLGAAQRRMTQDARSALRAQDVPGNLADMAAPRLAELVSQGMDVQSATMQSVMEANRQIQLANEALQKNQQMLILMQQQQRRMRTMMPTTQPVPFAN